MKKPVLFFDLGEVLVANHSNPVTRIGQTLMARGYTKTIVAEAMKVAETSWQILPASSGWISTWEQEEKVMTGYYAAVAKSIPDGTPALAAELFWLCHYVHHAELYPDVLTSLQELQVHYRLAIISNALPGTNWVIDRLNIRHYFKSIILSAHVGCAKPDERIYHIALDSTKSIPEECIFVDDQFANVEAARILGMRGFHLVRDQDKGQIHTLAELVYALKQ